ncbi:hypothetical protein O6H91_Y078200 [Diphasiastrum complanatum]|nr:hypothetical protein O6H91_Y078200 [Diphasiastrum complanatum]
METSSNSETSLAQFFSKDSDHLMRARCFLSILTATSEKFPCLHSVFDKRNRHRFGRETFSLSSRLKGHQTILKLRNCYRSINSNENAAIQYKKITVKYRRRLSITSYLRKSTTLGKRKRVMLFSKLKRRNPFISKNLSVNCQSESWKQEQLPRDRIATLQSIIPGGRRMSNDNLLRETANYIKLLRCQFDLLTSLVAIAEDRALWPTDYTSDL